MKTLLYILVLCIALLLVGCGSKSLTINDFEEIGFTKSEEIGVPTFGPTGKAWRGTLIGFASIPRMSMDISIFSEALSKSDKERLAGSQLPSLNEDYCYRFIHNVQFGIYYEDTIPKKTTNNTCDWVVANVSK